MKSSSLMQNKSFLVWLGGFYGLLAGLTIAMAAQITFMIVRRGIRDLPARRALVLLVGTEKKYYRKYQYEYREQREEKDIMERPAEHQLVIPEKMLAHKVRPGN